MKLLKLKQMWNLGKKIILLGFLLRVTETTYFSIKYGWHLRAINEDEKICDSIATIVSYFGVAFLLSVIFRLLDYYINRLKSK